MGLLKMRTDRSYLSSKRSHHIHLPFQITGFFLLPFPISFKKPAPTDSAKTTFIAPANKMASRSSDEMNEVEEGIRRTRLFVKYKKKQQLPLQQHHEKQENLQQKQQNTFQHKEEEEEEETRESSTTSATLGDIGAAVLDSAAASINDPYDPAYRPPSPPASRRVSSGSARNPNPLVLGREALAKDNDPLDSPVLPPNPPTSSAADNHAASPPLPRLSAVPSASARAAAATRGPPILKPPRRQRKRDKYVPSFILNLLNRYVKGRHRRGPFRSKSKVKWANGFPIIKIFQKDPIIETEDTTPPPEDEIPVYDPYIGAPGVVPFHPSSASIPSTVGSSDLGAAINEGSAAAFKRPLQKYSSLIADIPTDTPSRSSPKARSLEKSRATGSASLARHDTKDTLVQHLLSPKLAEKSIRQPTASSRRKDKFPDKGGSEEQKKNGGTENKP
ncbi:hypothetical protein TWF694_007068 [Orbilia ellipsospora]|uniref:Uncharacterized protein n=1 Tax=Orbilia ellipsospora TaxID=2528407 RepID=A0AAV9XPP0_9PEZI